MNLYWPEKKVLVTGAGGFIGSHLVQTLVEHGATVRAFVRYNSRRDWGLLSQLPKNYLNGVEIVSGDLRDLPTVQRAVQGVSHIFHLGALIAIPYSYINPEEVIATNVLGTLNVMVAARDAGTSRIVTASTSEVYGTAQRVPIDETHPLQGQSPYSASKIGADKVAESFYCSFGLPVVTVRPFNTFGPRQSTRAVIPTIIAQALTQSVIKLGNLHARRDLTYVSDTVDGFLQAAQATDICGETFNLGTGTEINIGDLANLIIDLLNKPVSIAVDPERLRPENSEVHRLLSDNSRARMRFGWEPKVSLEEGLRRTIAWMREHLYLYHPQEYQL